MDEQGQHPAILASDGERDRSIGLLSTAVSEGRLSLEEFSERVGLAQTARTQQDLAALTRDLPSVSGDLLAHAPAGDVVPAHSRYRAFCSRLVRRGPWELAPRTSFRCICGTIVLDLSEVRLSSAETEMEIYNLFGTVTVIVPDGVHVSVAGGGLFASEVVDAPARPAVAAAPRVRITTRGPGGTLRVRNAPAPAPH